MNAIYLSNRYETGKAYTYMGRNAVYKGKEGNCYHFQLDNGCKLLIDANHTYLIKEKD